MKNCTLCLGIAAVLLLFGCNKASTVVNENNPIIIIPEAARAGPRGVIDIREKMFIANVSDVYLNPDDYLGKNIRLEGIYKQEYDSDVNRTFCYVMRYGPGCCGNDQNAGFEVAFDLDNPNLDKPLENDWVEALGILAVYEENGYNYLNLQLSSLKIKKERGLERVYQ